MRSPIVLVLFPIIKPVLFFSTEDDGPISQVGLGIGKDEQSPGDPFCLMTFVGGIVWSHKKTTTIVVARILEMITHLENYDGIPEKSNLTTTSRY